MSIRALFFLQFFFFGLSFLGFGQSQTLPDSTVNESSLVVDTLFLTSKESVKNNRIGTYLSQVLKGSKNYAIELGKLKLILSEFPDTTEISERLPTLKQSTETLKDLTSRDRDLLNQRYLKGVENFIKSLENEKESYEVLVNRRMDDLIDVGKSLASIRNDSLLNLTLRDTTSFPLITKEINNLKTTIIELDSVLFQQEIILSNFQASLSEITISILDLSQFFKQSSVAIRQRSWQKEVNYIWEPKNYKNQVPVTTEFLSSIKVNMFVLKRYLEETQTLLGILFIVVLLLYFKLKSILDSISKRKEFADIILERVTYLRKNLFASCIIIVLPIFFLFFTNPPIVFSSIFSLIMVLFSGPILLFHFGKRIFLIWLLFMPLYLVGPTIGLHWQLTYAERPIIFAIALGGSLLGILMFRETKGKVFNESWVLQFLSIFILAFSIFSLGANSLGRFSIAKSYVIPGITGFYRGLALFLFTQVCLKAIYLWIESRKKETDVISTFFDFQEIQKRIQSILNILALAIWTYSIIYYLGFFDPLYDSIVKFLSDERTLGNATFEFGTILLFFLILIISSFLANNIAYFASIQDQKIAQSRTKRLGSSILLIRLGVIIIGFFIAMTAAKIPFDKLTIVLGALSVGIGFGLQTIINNLVSGIILAFERPIQIGDEIQVGTLMGTVKEVGIRASKIQAYDGSEIILPNGDLLSQSLINWTLSDKRKRVELMIGVAYNSDMEKVKTLIEKELENEKILSTPKPKVLMQNFGDSSVDFRVLFWVESFDYWIDIRAEVMSGIFQSFAENNIEIPFPKRDLYLKSVPSSWQEKISRPSENISIPTKESDPKSDENKKSSEI
ncbi:MAG: mechanosensitive ion channel [Algoriphagus sp.]|uniref:mechanosensitive ion channel family protein n=1 Tax=Algoriphagus sp. TaxID=1872435 RepID=UPI00262D8A96|nr:mechanosensitive ion channel domain-containing protein [Algoriphagus sp.]MDG1278741.1 mechanosensitive ion channel [Algoriphagus sp.]